MRDAGDSNIATNTRMHSQEHHQQSQGSETKTVDTTLMNTVTHCAHATS
jgi:hypothetical protein